MSGNYATAGAAVITAVSCAQCGVKAERPPLTWATSNESGRVSYYCDACSRENLRGIEARLDTPWW